MLARAPENFNPLNPQFKKVHISADKVRLMNVLTKKTASISIVFFVSLYVSILVCVSHLCFNITEKRQMIVLD